MALVGGGVVLLAALLFFSLRKKQSQIKDFDVEIQHLAGSDNDLIKEKDIKEIVRKAFSTNLAEARVEQVDVARIEQVLRQDPFIENAEN